MFVVPVLLAAALASAPQAAPKPGILIKKGLAEAVAAGRLEPAEGASYLAILARDVPVGRSCRWEYEFPFGSGKAPWISGMAQAVAAQALARASSKLADPTLLDAANAAYRLVPRLVRGLPQGLWIRLYGFSDDVVLNAQLQTVLSLQDYAQISGVQDAANLASALQTAAAKLLPAFDTGFWSLYSLSGDESPLGYHDYVISLLKKLGARTGDPLWSDTAARFAQYETEPPQIHP